MTQIEWAERTWQTVSGCTRVSPGCQHCYAERLAATRLAQTPKYTGVALMTADGPRWTGTVRLHEDALIEPLRRRKPTRYFVNAQGDTFHEDVPFAFIDRMMAMSLACAVVDNRPHTMLYLTKRPNRASDYFASRAPREHLLEWSRIADGLVTVAGGDVLLSECVEWHCAHHWSPDGTAIDNPGPFGALDNLWPLPNVWLGVSAEDQQRLDERWPSLARCPAAVRWLSLEPLLGPVNLSRVALDKLWFFPGLETGDMRASTESDWQLDALRGEPKAGIPSAGWVVVGGESGPGARPCNVGWIRDIVAQCGAARVPCYVKQLGANPWAEVAGGDGLEWPAGTVLDGRSPCEPIDGGEMANARVKLRDRRGADPAEWPAALRVRELPR